MEIIIIFKSVHNARFSFQSFRVFHCEEKREIELVSKVERFFNCEDDDQCNESPHRCFSPVFVVS